MSKLIHNPGPLILPALISLLLAGTVQAESEQTMLVLDASGSMWGQLDGKTKIEIAREALGQLVDDWPAGREVGLVAYGHRNKGDCNDIETILPVGPLDAAQLKKTVQGINPKGKTPLSAAVRQAAEAMKYTEEKATVVLLSDGRETCDMDPCALGAELEKLGVDFTAHVIGFDVASSADQAGLRCLAENTGGRFIPAANAEELNAALEQTAKAPEPAPAPEPEPVSGPEPLPQAELEAPAEAIKGTQIKVGLKAEDGLDGYVYLYAKGKEDQYISYGNVRAARTGGYQPAELRLPAATGEFTLKWLSSKKEVLAEAPLTITEAEISLEAPESATQGTLIKVGLNAPEGLDGYVYLYAKGKEDQYISYGNVRAARTGGYQPAELRLPAATGEFTLKWLSSKKEVLAEAPLTITEAEISLEAPESAPRGTLIEVDLNAPDGLDGYVYLYAKGKEDQYISYGNVRAARTGGYQPAELRLPAATGEFTLKWLSSKKEVLAEAPLTITEAEISLEAPESAPRGTLIEVGLNAPDGLDGYVYLYAQGRDQYISYGNVRADRIKGYQPASLRLPATPGEYTVKWLSGKDEVLAETPLTIADADINLQVPAQVETGTENLAVGLNGPDGLDGYVYLYARGRDKYISYGNVRADRIKGYQPTSIKLPEVTGQYELKWLSGKEEVLAEAPLEIVEEITEENSPVEQLTPQEQSDTMEKQAPAGTAAAVDDADAEEQTPAGEADAGEPADDADTETQTPADGADTPEPADDADTDEPVATEEQVPANEANADKPTDDADAEMQAPADEADTDEPAAAETPAPVTESSRAGLNPVPPDGLDSLDEAALKYYQEMGPLELAADLVPQPPYPVWRLHLALHPVMNADEVLSGYQVEVSRINLSPRLYQQLVNNFGAGIADKSLNDNTPSDHYTLPFTIAQNVNADLLVDEVSHAEYPPEGSCGLLPDCTALWQDHEDSDWGISSTPVLQAAPWHQDDIGVPALVRTLAQQAGWLQEENGQYRWITPEMPEGIGPGRPWVEVTIDSHAGNGGLLVADWMERVADDSVAAQLERVLYDPEQPESVQAFRANRCARGEQQDSARQTCP
ncbi:MAG TPA: VWA domain-containing protein [Thiolinea sp.]|nr:VWA domain-containing protein [Thiolinea sp.]